MISSTPSAGSASLTERRKAATRMEIARAAAGLFVSRGLKATRAEDIAQAAGIAPRTFYRYFATKEEAVAPLYSAGAERWAKALREAPAELPVPQALEHAVLHTLVTGRGVSAASWEWVRTLIRLAGASPALGKVWAEVCHTSETTIAEVLAERAAATEGRTSSPPAAPSAATEAADVPATPGTSDEAGAFAGAGTADGAAAAAAADASDPLEGPEVSGAPASDATPASPRQRFTAAVASAAVRVAVESWAATDAAPTGSQGPAELALHNLRALHGFGWEATPAKRA
ncbi:AcrR family transcriptional regulator [Streptomyces achromogenes]|uniref:AcrR family transcriptional regulator n=2 Tax=Streptomyces achromogenes TaxID=67255 RepID=A0ABU0Q168_STRAH|nr:AcrR family transcriptional regulator [Streptomyces achromogenes]MDQ0831587.1 AcrR family transcriptional regulator [Streptomyces achromogenes]